MRCLRSPLGFTLVELLVVLVIIAVLAALIFPTFAQARAKGRETACVSNLRQLGAAMHQYLQDFDDTFPNYDDNGLHWGTQMRVHIKDPDMLDCPDYPGRGGFSLAGRVGTESRGYALNQTLSQTVPVSDRQVGFPATTVVFCEVGFRQQPGGTEWTRGTISWPDVTPNTLEAPGATYIGSPGALRHHGGSNYVFADGHVKRHTPDQVWSVFRGNDGQHPSFGLKPL